MSTSQDFRVPPTPIRRILYPFERFLRIESSGGILLLIAAIIAFVWANLPHGSVVYHQFWHVPITIDIGGASLSMTLAQWINNSLMGVFFFVVGLEIKREMLVGELSTPRQAALPIAAALGGMVVPALIYTLFNAGGPGSEGWGIPMATDIAFAVGIMALLGRRAPLSLKIFITALAIVDDLGAVLVIALFYTGRINLTALAIAGFLLLIMFAFNRIGVRHAGVYLAVGIGLWLALYYSGLHATLAGVLAALAIPAKRRIDSRQFVSHGRYYLDKFESAGAGGVEGTDGGQRIIPNPDQQNALHGLEAAVEAAESPMAKLEHILHPWARYLIMPLFALANAGVTLLPSAEAAVNAATRAAAAAGTAVASGAGVIAHMTIAQMLVQPVSLGVIAGLFLGKPIGIFLTSWLAIRIGIGVKPRGVSWGALLGAGSLGGIGFTMSLFIADLGLRAGTLLTEAKIGFLTASLASGIVGSAILLITGKKAEEGHGKG
jgi:NhaA family Na+:H+ antiporter